MHRLLLLLALASPFVGACQSRGQLVLGLATDLAARGQIDEVSLTVTRSGDTTPTVQFDWDLSGVIAEDYSLPGSFNLYAEDGGQPDFDVVIDGLLGGQLKVERVSQLGIVKNDELFVRLGLTASCETVSCPSTLACVEGQCVASFLDPRRLPAYKTDLVKNVACESTTKYIDTSSHDPMPLLGAGTCADGGSCREGICLANPATLPGADPTPFTGGAAELFASTSRAFFPVGDLDTPRYFSSATPLSDGRVLVVGGLSTPTIDGSGAAVSGAAIYDPTKGAFRRVSTPDLALGALSATLLADNTVLLVGTNEGMPGAMLFDAASETFVVLSSPTQLRQFHTATLLQDGTVLLFGGLASTGTIATVNERYNPTTRAFTPIKGTALDAVYFHQATLLKEGTVYLSGGFTQGSEGLDATAATELYDPTTDSFSEMASMVIPRAMHTVTLLSDGTMLAVGGFSSFTDGSANANPEFLVATDSTPPALTSFPPIARGAQLAIPLGKDNILFVGGSVELATTLSADNGAFVYDPTNRTFVSIASPSLARVAAFGVLIASSTDLLVGGGVPANAGGGDGGSTTSDTGFVSDGFTSADFNVTFDLMASTCDPVGAKASGCSTKCTIAGLATFGSGLYTNVGPRCSTVGGQNIGIGETCTPVNDPNSTGDDGCVQGSTCLTDISDGSYRCQQICHSDQDCTTDNGRTRCAMVVTGSNVSGLGICMQSCNYGDDSDTCQVAITMDLGMQTASCHFAPNVATPGAIQEEQGVCRFDGNASYSQACDDTMPTQATSCSSDTVCVSGACAFMCSPDLNECETTCNAIIANDPSGDGWCMEAS